MSFKGIGREPADGRVRPYVVVKGLNVAEYGDFGGVSGGEVLQMDALAFEAGEEVLGHSVVIRVALAGHTLPKAIAIQGVPISDGSILYTSVRVEDQSLLRLLPPHRHFQGGEGQLGVDAI